MIDLTALLLWGLVVISRFNLKEGAATLCPFKDDSDIYEEIKNVAMDQHSGPAEKLESLHCLMGSAASRHESYFWLSANLFGVQAFTESHHFSVQCLQANPYIGPCWHVLVEASHALGLMEQAFFYAEFIKLYFPDDQSSLFNSNRFSQLREMRNSSSMTPFQIYAKLKNVNLNSGRIEIFNILETQEFLGILEEAVDSSSACSKFAAGIAKSTSGPRWEHEPIKLYYSGMRDFTIPFAETMTAMSDVLSRLGIRHKIVSTIEPDDRALYIFTFATLGSGTFDNLPKNYIFWNFEKWPKVIARSLTWQDYPGVIAASGVPAYPYPVHLIAGAIAVWDSNPSNIPTWRSATSVGGRKVPLFMVPPVTPFADLRLACDHVRTTSAQRMLGPTAATTGTAVHLARPVDVLFYGGKSLHRLRLLQALEEHSFAHSEGEGEGESEGGQRRGKWRLKMFLNYDLAGFARDAAIDQAKVAL